MSQLNYSVHPRERCYYFICLLITALAYFWLLYGSQHFMGMLGQVASNSSNMTIIAIIGFLVLSSVLSKIIFMGYLRGDGIEITAVQFPAIYAVIQRQAATLNLSKTPRLYLLHAENLFNAFAARFWFKNYVVLYNSVLEAAYEESEAAVEFIIGHELGHVKRGHLSFFKNFFIFPAFFVPFLRNAYFRACEYTCDSIGYALSPTGAQSGVLILAAGKKLYKKVNAEQLIGQFEQQRGFCTWLAEIFSTHPHSAKRVQAIWQHPFSKLEKSEKPF